jgi:hypothetical protein
MKRFVFSALASRPQGTSNLNHHFAGLVEATTYEEAMGKALLIALKLYPTQDGWRSHSVDVQNDTPLLVEDVAWKPGYNPANS